MGLKSFVQNIWNATPRHSVEHRNRPVKQKRRYDGAKRGRNYADWLTSSKSANADIWADITTLRNRSRDVIRNNDYARGVIGKLVDNVVYLGISFQAQVKQVKNPTANDDRINNLIETNFKAWAEQKLWCHTAGQLDFVGIQQLVMRSTLESGEVFIRKVKQSFSGSPVPFALEIIEADQLAEDHNVVYGGNQIIMGIEVNSWQRPVAYWFYKNHPGDTPLTSPLKGGTWGVGSRDMQRIPATEIIHLYLSDRPNQARGLPLLYSTLLRLKNVGDYEESEQLAAKLAACIMAMITSPYSDLLKEPEGDNGDLPADERFEPGVMRYLAPGESMEAFDPKRPNANLVAFIEQQLRASGAGVGVSYETVSNDYSKTNYSSSRLSLITARDRYKVLQVWFATNFLKEVIYGNPESDGWLDMAVLAGVLNFPDYELRPQRYRATKWQFRGWAWVDPHKEVKATLDSLAGGMTSLTDFYAEQGKDFEESVKVIAREREMLKQLGIEVNFGNAIVSEVEEVSPSGETPDARVDREVKGKTGNSEDN